MIIISPYAKGIREHERISELRGTPHPKNYPHWKELISMINASSHIEPIIQVGINGEVGFVSDFRKNLPLTELAKLVKECRTWISVDSFFQHFCWDLGKPGIVLFGQSDPNIFGHPENTNLLKDRKYLRDRQYWQWEQTMHNPEHFVKPDVVIDALKLFK